MPKAPPKNGYFYFMLDFRRREEQQGRRFPRGMAEVSEAASDEWKALPQHEKDDYNAYAKENRNREDRPNMVKKPKPLEKKYNCKGENLAVLKRQEEQKEARDLAIQNFVLDFVEGRDIEDWMHERLHLIHVNYFCKTEDKDQIYYPAELAICKFSLKEGLLDTYHTFIDPGEIRKGYMFTVKERSDRYHRITLAHVKEQESSKQQDLIFDRVCKFLELDKKVSVPLFTLPDDLFKNTSLRAVEETLKGLWHSKHSSVSEDDAWRRFFPLYPLQTLFYRMKNYFYRSYDKEAERDAAMPNTAIGLQELNKDTYNMKDEYACEYHVEMDAVAMCSKSYVLRWAQIIRDHCCPFLDIDVEDVARSVTTGDYGATASWGGWGSSHAPSRASSYAPSHATHAYKDDEDEDENNDDQFEDCRSVVSGASGWTNMSKLNDASMGFSTEKKGDVAGPSSSASQTSKQSSVWHGGKGRAQRVRAAALTMDDENFPSLGGIGGGMRRMNIK